MKKVFGLFFSLFAFCIILAACGSTSCKHTYDYACDTVCNVCGGEREVAAHDYSAPSCTTAKTCKFCGVVDVSALGHTWDAASCFVPKTCGVCKETEGEPLDQSEGLLEIVKALKQHGKTVVLFTGYQYKELVHRAQKRSGNLPIL